MWDLFLQLCTQTPQIKPSQKPTIDDHKTIVRLQISIFGTVLLSIQIRDQQIRLKISIKKYKQIPVYGHNLLDGGKIDRLSVFASLWCGKYFHIVVYATSKNTTEIIATSTCAQYSCFFYYFIVYPICRQTHCFRSLSDKLFSCLNSRKIQWSKLVLESVLVNGSIHTSVEQYCFHFSCTLHQEKLASKKFGYLACDR